MGINSPKQTLRRPKHIENPKDVEYILSLTQEQASQKDTIMELFADFGDGPKYNTYDIIDIPPKTYGKTKKNKSKLFVHRFKWTDSNYTEELKVITEEIKMLEKNYG